MGKDIHQPVVAEHGMLFWTTLSAWAECWLYSPCHVVLITVKCCVKNLCLYETSDTLRHQDIFIFSELDNLNRTDVSLASLACHMTATISKWGGLFCIFSFQLFPSHTHVFASPLCSSPVVLYLRFKCFCSMPFILLLFCLDDSVEENFAAPFMLGSGGAYAGSLLQFCPVQNKATRSC